MPDFADFDPACWVETDHVLVRAPKRRGVRASIKQTLMNALVTASVGVACFGIVPLGATRASVGAADTVTFNARAPSNAKAEVPEGYWANAVRALRGATRLPEPAELDGFPDLL